MVVIYNESQLVRPQVLQLEHGKESKIRNLSQYYDKTR